MTTYPVSYTSVNDVYSVLPINSLSNLTFSDVAYYVGRVENMMNSKLSRSYELPITQEIKLLSTIAADLSIYELLSKRMYAQYPLEDSEWASRYKDSMSLLEDIADGKENLLTNSFTVLDKKTQNAMYVWSNTMNYTPTMNEDSMDNHVIDSDKLDDIADGR